MEDILCMSFLSPSVLATASYDGEIVIWNTNSEQASRHLNQRARKRNMTRGKSFVLNKEPSQLATVAENSEGKSTAGSIISESRPKSRPKSRAISRVSQGSADQAEFSVAVAKLLFLESRKSNSAGGGANLVSCGGNGWVRFWNSSKNKLLAEFVAHLHAGSIIMATDKKNQFLVTGDVDGTVKVWEIAEYCTHHVDTTSQTPPTLKCQYQAHQDMVNSLDLCERNDRHLVISASSDCSVAVWDVYGNKIGVFGQEEHWKIEQYDPTAEVEEEEDKQEEATENLDLDLVESDNDSQWEPDEKAISEPYDYRVNTWNSTFLGKDYQELRVRKRERRQPGTIPNLPYLHWEKTGAPPAGPYSALETQELDDVSPLTKPDAEKYFLERPGSADHIPKLPELAETLKTAYDEKSLFPKYILDYEKRFNEMRRNPSQTTTKSLRTNFQNIGMGLSQIGTKQSPRKNRGHKLKPLSHRKSSLSVSVQD